MNFNLDFSIETSEDRKNFLNQFDLQTLTPKELELCANYILYGKDSDKDFTSCVDRKEVQIKTKFSSYSKKEPVSLDALMESPTFNENQLKRNPIIYKKPKVKLNREKAQNIPGMKELWEGIDKLQKNWNQNTGKEEKTEETPTLNQKQLYYLRHQLIDLRRQQYYLMDSVVQTLLPPQNKGQYYDFISDVQMNYPVFPRGTMREEYDINFWRPRQDLEPSKSTDAELQDCIENNKLHFNFLNKDHIYQLILFYWDIKAAVKEVPDSPLHNLLWTLDFYIEKANLSEQQLLIVRDKKLRIPNKEIAQHLQNELNIYHQENYISTIWNKITQKIADAAELNYDEWLNKDFDKSWKICNTCKEELLRDPRNFVRKTKAPDGLTNRCKMCDCKARGTIKK